MKTATFLRQLDRGTDKLDARLYRLSEPLINEYGSGSKGIRRSHYVVVSGSSFPELPQPETYIFLADGHGEILNWLECPGSFHGRVDHAEALRDAGYEIIDGESVRKGEQED